MFIDEEFEFINSQISHHERSVEYFHSKRDHAKANRHSGILRRFRDILPKMHEAKEIASRGPAIVHKEVSEKIGSRFGDVSELPPELRSQIVSMQYDETEQQILNVVTDDYVGVATIDEIMVGLFRHYTEIHQREALATKIYRMTRKELLSSVPKRKGVYAIPGTVLPETSEQQSDGDEQ